MRDRRTIFLSANKTYMAILLPEQFMAYHPDSKT